jgi:hypothetical protein
VAAFLRSLPPTARIFDWADRLGPDVRAHYWEKAPVFLIQEDADRERAARTLVELGHATNALGLLTIAIQHGNPPDPDLVAEALSKATVDFPASNLPMFTYYVTSLLTYLDTQPQTSRQRLAQLEWRYLPLLEPHERPTRVLHQELARDPEFFVEIIETIYIPEHDEDGQERQITDEQCQRATLSYQLLRSWHTIPGSLSAPEAPAGPSLGEWSPSPAPCSQSESSCVPVTSSSARSSARSPKTPMAPGRALPCARSSKTPGAKISNRASISQSSIAAA